MTTLLPVFISIFIESFPIFVRLYNQGCHLGDVRGREIHPQVWTNQASWKNRTTSWHIWFLKNQPKMFENLWGIFSWLMANSLGKLCVKCVKTSHFYRYLERVAPFLRFYVRSPPTCHNKFLVITSAVTSGFGIPLKQ